MNDLFGLDELLSDEVLIQRNEIEVDSGISARASLALQRMIDFQS